MFHFAWVMWDNCSVNPLILKTFCHFHKFQKNLWQHHLTLNILGMIVTFNGQPCIHQYKPIKKRLLVLYFLLKWFNLDQWYIFFPLIWLTIWFFFGYLRIWKILREPLQCIFADYLYIGSHLSLTTINSATLPCKSRNYIFNRTCLFPVLFCNLFGYCFILNHFQKVSSLKNYSWNFYHIVFILGTKKNIP